MEVATFDQGCSAGTVAPAAKVASLMQSTTLVRQVRFVSGIEVIVLPDYIAGPYVDINVAFDPWPAWIFGQIFNHWNSVWSNTLIAAICPPTPIGAPMHAPAAAPPPAPPPPSPPPPS